MLYFLINDKFKNQYLIYIILFQIMAFPLFDFPHISISLIPVLSYLIEYKCQNRFIKEIKLISITFLFFVTLFVNIPFIIKNANIYHKKPSLQQQTLVMDYHLI